MGILDILQKKNNKRTIQDIISQEYKQKYFDECKFIWKNYVPKNGQATTLQGELLREIEKIRCEAQDNGNINWDNDYTYFCDFISKKLSEQTIFSKSEKKEIVLIMSYLKECGIYAQNYHKGEILENAVDIDKLAYVKDNLYDIICDKIGQLHKENGTVLPYEKNNEIKR